MSISISGVSYNTPKRAVNIDLKDVDSNDHKQKHNLNELQDMFAKNVDLEMIKSV